MAHFATEVLIDAAPEKVWEAVRDVGAVHRRLVPGLLTDTQMDGDARIVTFATGMVLRELIVDIDDGARRLVWAVVGKPVVHHQGVMQVFAEAGGGSRVRWDADILPAPLLDMARPHMESGMAVMKKTLEQHADDRM